jgi:pimeloyl-ACP methyl ester carboxylesterase
MTHFAYRRRIAICLGGMAMASAMVATPIAGDDSETLLTIDHQVRLRSTVPAITGQPATIYVRERVKAGMALRGNTAGDRVVLFVHGAGTPGAVAFDVPHQDYSWMAYLAREGFDVFAMDFTGYGRSTRPPAMNDPCNLAPDQQAAFVPQLLPAACRPTYQHQMTTIASDWDDLGAVVEYLRALRHVDRVSLVAWSLGAPRSAGYAAQHPDKVRSLVLLAPAYNRTTPPEPSGTMPAAGVAMNIQSRSAFTANWDRQVGCPAQYETAAHDAVWSEMLESDPVGATWGDGVRRAPSVTVWGWNSAMASRMRTPALLVTGAHDKQVLPDRVHELYADLGASDKVLVDLACASHNAMWERNHLLLFRASLEWLQQGSVNGMKMGKIKIGE